MYITTQIINRTLWQIHICRKILYLTCVPFGVNTYHLGTTALTNELCLKREALAQWIFKLIRRGMGRWVAFCTELHFFALLARQLFNFPGDNLFYLPDTRQTYLILAVLTFRTLYIPGVQMFYFCALTCIIQPTLTVNFLIAQYLILHILCALYLSGAHFPYLTFVYCNYIYLTRYSLSSPTLFYQHQPYLILNSFLYHTWCSLYLPDARLSYKTQTR